MQTLQALKELEDAVSAIREITIQKDFEGLSQELPEELSSVLHRLTEVLSRDDAERLLEVGQCRHISCRKVEG